MQTLKRKIYLLLDPNQGGTFWDKLVNTTIVTLIILNTLAVSLETMDNFFHAHRQLFRDFEDFSIIFFTVEYILRVWCCTEDERYKDPVRGRIKYMLTAGALVDFFAVAPFFIPLTFFLDLRFIRILRLLRFLRVFKMGRYLKASKLLTNVIKSKREELIMSLVITIFLVVVSASFMYFVEHDAQPDKFSSIPETMWWSVATLTTMGHPSVYPITMMGRFMASIIAILGIGMFALPAGILAAGFSEEIKHTRKKRYCHHCGHELD